MAAFYHDSRQRRLFEEGTNRNGIPRGPSACEIDLLEWSPGTAAFLYGYTDYFHCGWKTHPALLLTLGLGDPLAEGRIIETNAQALRSRAQPRLQIL